MKGLIVLCGNDETGKTSVCNMINDLFLAKKSPYIAIERSYDTLKLAEYGIDSNLKSRINIKVLDELTLKYTFEDR